MWPLPWEMCSLHFFLKQYWAWESSLMLFLIERSVIAGCISEIPMWKDAACLSTELQMSNDPSTREVSSAAQGIKMAQIVTGISEKMSRGFLQISQPGLLSVEKKEHYLKSEIQHWIFSNAHYVSATLEHQPLHWRFIHTFILVQALLQSRSASPVGHQQTECPCLWFG